MKLLNLAAVAALVAVGAWAEQIIDYNKIDSGEYPPGVYGFYWDGEKELVMHKDPERIPIRETQVTFGGYCGKFDKNVGIKRESSSDTGCMPTPLTLTFGKDKNGLPLLKDTYFEYTTEWSSGTGCDGKTTVFKVVDKFFEENTTREVKRCEYEYRIEREPKP